MKKNRKKISKQKKCMKKSRRGKVQSLQNRKPCGRKRKSVIAKNSAPKVRTGDKNCRLQSPVLPGTKLPLFGTKSVPRKNRTKSQQRTCRFSGQPRRYRALLLVLCSGRLFVRSPARRSYHLIYYYKYFTSRRAARFTTFKISFYGNSKKGKRKGFPGGGGGGGWAGGRASR